MKPGRELDALVAEKVMECKLLTEVHPYYPKVKLFDCGCKNHIHGDRNRQGSGLRKYSTDISSAWEVVEKLTDDNAERFELTRLQQYPLPREHKDWCAEQGMNGPGYSQHYVAIVGYGRDEIRVIADTAPHAICLAALKALEL